jgi:hypothetical protein
LLGGTATVGCGRAPLAAQRPDAAMAADASKGDDRADSSPAFVLPEVPPATLGKPDGAPPRDAVAVSGDGAAVTIQDIMDSCNLPSQAQSAVAACLDSLRASWTTGLAQELAGESCSTVEGRLDDFSCRNWPCRSSPQGSSDEFSAGAIPYCEPVIIYMGVRFV